MVRANIRARWVRRDDHMARRIVVGLRKPVKRFRLVNLAKQWNWDEMFNRIDNGEAGVNDFMDYAVCRAWAAAPPPAPHLESALPSMPSISSVSDVVPRWGVVVPQMRWTCLCWAVASPVDMSIGVIDELVRRGATVSGVVDVYGRTPLHIAVESGHIDSVKRLVHHGADICSLDTSGLAPVDAHRRDMLSGTEIRAYLHGKANARRHWATARAFVQVYPYALFWHAHSCKQLCAPGGTWAERDRTAFEEEFIAPRD